MISDSHISLLAHSRRPAAGRLRRLRGHQGRLGASSGGSEGAETSSRSSPTRPRRSSTTRSSPRSSKTEAGKDVGFKTSFGASGEQSRAVEGGLKADVVSFSIEPDIERLVEAGLVDKRLDRTRPRRRASCRQSIVSFIVRKGNPKDIKTWDDLVKPGVKVVTPEPVHLGRGQVEPARAPTRHGGPRLRGEADQRPRLGPAQVRPRGAADLHRRRGRRAPLLRVRGHDGASRRARRTSSSCVPRRHDQDRDQHRPDQGRPAPRRRRSSTTCSAPRARRSSPSWGYRPGRTRGRSRPTKYAVPEPAQGHDDRRPRRLVEGQRRAVRPRERARSPRSRKTRGSRRRK